MVTRTEVILIDDLDGTPAERTVSFALDGQDYETELAPGNIAALKSGLAPYIGAARLVVNHGKRKGKRGRRTIIPAAAPPATTGATTTEIRAWAKTRPDLALNPRGRIPANVIAAFNATHGRM